MRSSHCGLRIANCGLAHAGPFAGNPQSAIRNPQCPEGGQITLEYVLLLACIVLPLVSVVYMLWEILMYFYWNNALIVSIPYL